MLPKSNLTVSFFSVSVSATVTKSSGDSFVPTSETLAKDTGNTKITVYYDSALPKTANRVLDVAAK